MITIDDIQGHWTRRWIKAPGFEDHTTRVHWMQCGTTYADVRIPQDRPEMEGAATLADQTADVLLRLLAAEGFAGVVSLEGSECTWHRAINWHGVPEGLDVGDIRFDAEGRMIETGVHADYTELWEHSDAPERRSCRFEGEGWVGYLVCIGTACVLGIGKPTAPGIKPVLQQLESGSIPPEAPALFGGVHALCAWDGQHAVATLATNPLCEGATVLSFNQDDIIWHQTQFCGTRRDIAMTLT